MATNKNKKIKKILPILFLLLIIIPVFANAQIIPNCSPNCGYNDLLTLVNNVINWIIMISVPIAAGVFAWAGIKYMTTGVADQKSEAKAMLWKVFWGFVAILSAWIIVTTITGALLSPDFKNSVPVEGVNKN
jgi:fumarate reductase subunit D